MRVLALSGSLQARSANTRLVNLAALIAERGGIAVDCFSGLDTLPYFNPDLDGDPAPPTVADFRARLALSDGVLIASPEYALEMPGVLKNGLDWLVSSGTLYGKRVAVLCAAPHVERGRYAREALQRTLGAQGAEVVLSQTIAMPPNGPAEPPPEVERAVQAALQLLVSA